MSATYEIEFYDHSFTRSIVLTGWKYLEFHQKLNRAWNSVLRINLTYDDNRTTWLRDTLVRGFLMIVNRRDEDGNINRVYEGEHRTIVDQMLSQGSLEFTLYSSGYTSWLKNRIVIPASGESHSIKTGPAETVMREFVRDQIVSPTDSLRRIISVNLPEPDSGAGNTVTYSARYTNLYTVISRMAEQGAVDFGITGRDTVGEADFIVKSLWGLDRTAGNSDANVPVIFDVTYGNMDIPIFSKNGGEEKNWIYVGGQGEGVDRDIRQVVGGTQSVSPFNRREAFVDARREKTDEGLVTAGKNYLRDNRYVERLTFNLIQVEGTKWLQHWSLGDLVTARYFSNSVTKKIQEVSVFVTAGSQASTGQVEQINAELEDV